MSKIPSIAIVAALMAVIALAVYFETRDQDAHQTPEAEAIRFAGEADRKLGGNAAKFGPFGWIPPNYITPESLDLEAWLAGKDRRDRYAIAKQAALYKNLALPADPARKLSIFRWDIREPVFTEAEKTTGWRSLRNKPGRQEACRNARRR